MGTTDKKLTTYLAHRTEFINYASAIVGDRAQGEDVVQEAYIRLNATPSDRQIDQPVGYFRRIIRNLAIDWCRRATTERQRLDSDADLTLVAGDHPSQEELISHQYELRIMIEAMAELPDRTRQVLHMHRVDGCTLKSIAEQFDISVTQAHSLVFDGLSHCRRRLAERS